jgi:type II secretory pathway component PulM
MKNKYLYSFLKDINFRALCMLPVLGAVLCFVLIRLGIRQSLEFKEIQAQQAIIAQIPSLETKILQLKGNVNGLVLNGVISDNAQSMAIINNRLVKFEEIIDGKRLVTLTKQSAMLCDVVSDKCITLYLGK